MLANAEGEIGKQGFHDPGTLSNVIGETSKGEMPCQQSMLLGTAIEADIKKGKVVHPTIGEVTEGRDGLGRKWWSNQDWTDLLHEIDFLQTTILLERREAIIICLEHK